LEPRVQIIRRSRRPLLRGLEQARRSALAHHVHRIVPMGPRVLISGTWYKTRPDRYFGIMNMYPGKIYLGGGEPLALDGLLVGGVGVAGLPEGVDEKSARAGIEAWMKFRGTMKK